MLCAVKIVKFNAFEVKYDVCDIEVLKFRIYHCVGGVGQILETRDHFGC